MDMLATGFDQLTTILVVFFSVSVVAVSIHQTFSFFRRTPRKKVIELFAFGCGGFMSATGTVVNVRLGGPTIVTLVGISVFLIVSVVGIYRNKDYITGD